jgi:hypothetical protein
VQGGRLLSLSEKNTSSTPWGLILITQLVGLMGLSSLLVRLQGQWYDFALVGLFFAYEVLVIRSLVRRAKGAPSVSIDI